MNDELEDARSEILSNQGKSGSAPGALWVPIPELDWDDDAAVDAWCQQVWELAVKRLGTK